MVVGDAVITSNASMRPPWFRATGALAVGEFGVPGVKGVDQPEPGARTTCDTRCDRKSPLSHLRAVQRNRYVSVHKIPLGLLPEYSTPLHQLSGGFPKVRPQGTYSRRH